jgi:hypothetical protein
MFGVKELDEGIERVAIGALRVRAAGARGSDYWTMSEREQCYGV